MAPPRVLALVLAGGAGSRLEVLTEHRAKGAVPVLGTHRLVDFPLSNALHSGISDVWVTVQFHPVSLAQHLANGRPWDLDRTAGGLVVVPPHRGTERGGWHTGTADSLWRTAGLVREFDPEVLLLTSSDAVYTLDYARVVEEHLSSDAEVTMVTTQVPRDDASRYGVVEVGDDGAVLRYAYKPDEPASATVATEVFALDPRRVLDRLEALARADSDGDGDADHEDGGLGDLGDALLPQVVADGAARSHPQTGYWRDLGTIPAYWEAHREVLGEDPPVDVDDPAWPVLTRGGERGGVRGPARLLAGAAVEDSLVASGARVAGSVRGSVLSRGVVVEPGATVVDSVLLPGARVMAGARVVRAVLDDDVVVGRGAVVGDDADSSGGSSGEGGDAGRVTVLGHAVRLRDGEHVAAGARVPEPEPGR